MPELSKLQIRAKVLSVISQIKSTGEYNEKLLKTFYDELESIEDKHTLFDIFIKEYIKMNENEFTFSGCLIKELVDIDYIQDKVFEILKSANYSDDAKYKLVQLLRVAGSNIDYNSVPQYFENPKEVLDSDTRKLLEKAVFNPESMLDFLDFVAAVTENDRNILLKSLQLDYQGDMLANIIYPILYSDFDDKFKLNAIEILSESKSSLAIEPFNYLIKTSENEQILHECKLGLKKLKLAGASEEKAKEYFTSIIKNTTPAEFFTTIPDGQGNQALLISRIDHTTDKFLLSAVVINDKDGIVDCFGFYNISRAELVKVLSRFYQSEGKYKVNDKYVKTRIDNAIQTTINNKYTFPYEFICWNVLTKDIETENFSVEQVLNDNLSVLNTTKDTILTLLTKDYSFRWYIKPDENEVLNNLTKEIYNTDSICIEDINNMIKTNIDNIFDKDNENIWKLRILQCCYLLLSNNLKTDAEIFYSIANNSQYFYTFKCVLIQRSIFNHFAALKESAKRPIITTNIFRKKEEKKEKLNINQIEYIIDLIKKNWINE